MSKDEKKRNRAQRRAVRGWLHRTRYEEDHTAPDDFSPQFERLPKKPKKNETPEEN